VTLSEDLEELLRFATAIGGRYMGADRAEEFGQRNGVEGELVVRIRPTRIHGARDVAGYLFGPPGWAPDGNGLTTENMRRRAGLAPAAAPEGYGIQTAR